MAQEHSLWLPERGPEYNRLDELITELARTHQNALVFAPITMVGGVREKPEIVRSRTAGLGKTRTPFEVSLVAA